MPDKEVKLSEDEIEFLLHEIQIDAMFNSKINNLWKKLNKSVNNRYINDGITPILDKEFNKRVYKTKLKQRD